jgi:hypothetical protein
MRFVFRNYRNWLRRAIMKNTQMAKNAFFSAVIAMACAIGLASTAMADHKSNVPIYNFATRGANYPGEPSDGACAADRPGQGCRRVVGSCGEHGNPIYTTRAVANALQQATGEGQEIPVHLVSITGQFTNYCAPSDGRWTVFCLSGLVPCWDTPRKMRGIRLLSMVQGRGISIEVQQAKAGHLVHLSKLQWQRVCGLA